jgi:hypothetical protein
LASFGRGGAPLWVTEHGYPADPAYQHDPDYRGGEAAQAAYLRDSLPTLVRAGAAQIFVTTRDTWTDEFGEASPYSSEGLARVDSSAPYPARRRPAFGVVRALANQWPRVPHTMATEAQLTAVRNRNAIACFTATGKRGTLHKRIVQGRRTITRMREQARRAERADRRRRAAALRRGIRGWLRDLRDLKRRHTAAGERAKTRCAVVDIMQARIDTGT